MIKCKKTSLLAYNKLATQVGETQIWLTLKFAEPENLQSSARIRPYLLYKRSLRR